MSRSWDGHWRNRKNKPSLTKKYVIKKKIKSKMVTKGIFYAKVLPSAKILHRTKTNSTIWFSRQLERKKVSPWFLISMYHRLLIHWQSSPLIQKASEEGFLSKKPPANGGNHGKHLSRRKNKVKKQSNRLIYISTKEKPLDLSFTDRPFIYPIKNPRSTRIQRGGSRERYQAFCLARIRVIKMSPVRTWSGNLQKEGERKKLFWFFIWQSAAADNASGTRKT